MRRICWTLLPLAGFAVVGGAPPLRAELCGAGHVPDCAGQVQKPVSYTWLKTKGWAYYCTGDHPYFWSMVDGYPRNYTWDNSCFSVTENNVYEDWNKFDATITNWCSKSEVLTLTLGCSSSPPPTSE